MTASARRTRKPFAWMLATAAMFSAVLPETSALAAEAVESAKVGQAITDTAISTKLRAKLLADERIKNSDVDVHTTDRVVTLSGKAATSDVKAAAEALALRQEGVKGVDNQLVLATDPTLAQKAGSSVHKAGQSIRHAASATGEVASDSYITSKIKSKLLAAKGLSASGIDVTTVDGAVTLTGSVPRASEQAEAIRIAKDTIGVKSVDADPLKAAAK